MGLEGFYRPSVTYIADAKSSPTAPSSPSDDPLQPVGSESLLLPPERSEVR